MDLDNTLYDHVSQQVPPKHIEALRILKNKGYKICICSGRPYLLVKDIHLESLIDWDGFICGNGCYVYDKDIHPLYKKVISANDTKKIFDYAASQDLGVIGLGNVKMATRDDQKVEEMIESMHFTNIEFRDLKDSDEFSNILLKPDDPLQRVPYLDALSGIDPVYMNNFIEIKRAHSSKFQGIQILMEYFHEPVHNYLAFGDAAIDYEMLDNASVAVMVANGDKRLKQIPGIHIAPSCHDGGVYTWLKENGWI